MVYHIAGGIWDNSKDVDDQHSWIEVLEGDKDQIRLVDPTQDEGGLITRRGMDVGRAMRVEGMPTKVIRKGADLRIKPLLDVESFYGQFLVSDAVKAIVEELEPGIHQFFPMELYVGGDFQRTDFFFNICNRLDTMHPEKTFPRNVRGFYNPKRGEPSALVFSIEKFGSHHAWRDKFKSGAFISDTLAKRLQDTAITGLSYQYFQEA